MATIPTSRAAGRYTPTTPARVHPAGPSGMTAPMSTSPAVVRLSVLIAVLALVVAGAGLLWPGDEGSTTFTTQRGQVVELYGRGLYRHDTLFTGALNRGTDAITLVLGIPLLVVALHRYRRGSLRGGLLLLGALAWFVYVGASYALGAVAYNDLFLVYVALFSASLFALVLAFRSLDLRSFAARVSNQMPRRGLSVFLLASGVLTLGVWLITPLSALIGRETPERLDIYTTLFTHAFDMAVIVPALLIAGMLVRRGDPLGYVLAFPLFVLEMLLAPMISPGPSDTPACT
jgi:hypothetical protein